MTSRHDELGRILRAALQEEANVMQIDTSAAAERLQPELAHSGRRKRRVAAALAAAAAAAAVAVVGVVMWNGESDVRPSPAPAVNPLDQPHPALASPRDDYVYFLDTGAIAPLPKSIVRTAGGSVPAMYAVSPDGSRLAYVGTGEHGRTQIFTAGIDGAGVRQVTDAPAGVSGPAWSPDGGSIAYLGADYGDPGDLFILKVATGETRQVTHGARIGWLRQFTPDGSSLLFTGGRGTSPLLRTVPVTGGKTEPYLGRPAGTDQELPIHAGNVSLSPDGSQVTYLAEAKDGTGPVRWLANADGSDQRVIPGDESSEGGGAWSPDGSRIACSDGESGGIVLVDVADPQPSLAIAKGEGAVWLDDQTLLVDR